MTLLNTLLVAILFITALALVQVTNDTRKAFITLNALQQERDSLDTEWSKMQLEQSTYSGHNRIDGVARSRLQMVIPRDYVVIEVKP